MQRNAEQCVFPVAHGSVPLTLQRNVGGLYLSASFWQLMLIGGDAVLLMVVLTLVLWLGPVFFTQWQNLTAWLDRWDLRLICFVILLLSWNGMVRVTHAQELSIAANRFKSLIGVLFTLVLVSGLWLLLTYTFFLRHALSPVSVTCLFLLLAAPLLASWRLLLAEIIHLPFFRRRAVIVGVNAASDSLLRELCRSRRSGLTVLGYISSNIKAPFEHHGLPILGNKSMLHTLIEREVIDVIIMSMDYKVHPEFFQVALKAAQHGISVVPMTLVYENLSGKIPVKHVGEQWYAALPIELDLSPLYLFWTRLLDLCFGLCAGFCLLLLLAPLALLISLDSSGSVFYSQERLGQHGRPFRIYKFRSMCNNAERTGQAVWARSSDERVTRVGRFLRTTHLDELPQVLNILRGEMSLIGPRPERAEFVALLETSIPFYRCRLSIKPGLTGWAQVKYRYGNTENDALMKLQYDLYYIKHRSLTLDLFIVLRTLLEMIFCRGV
jgi:exopolysaccharide biosynthesis polyprenyl glycosylphosphotransferase